MEPLWSLYITAPDETVWGQCCMRMALESAGLAPIEWITSTLTALYAAERVAETKDYKAALGNHAIGRWSARQSP
jgi:hypothetical protein